MDAWNICNKVNSAVSFCLLMIIKCSISLPYCIFFVHFPYAHIHIYKYLYTLHTDTKRFLPATYLSHRLHSADNVSWSTTSKHFYPKKCLVAKLLMKSIETLRNQFFNLITISRSSLLITVQIHLDLLYHSYAYN